MKFIEIVKKHIGPPVKIDEIIKELGLLLDQDAELEPEISGELERQENGGFRISANKGDGENRKRFTIAHELGHYMLHAHLIGDGVDDNKAYRSDPAGNFFNKAIKPQHETEANRFAAQLLMPKKMLEKRAKTGVSVNDLAECFKVSKAAMNIRLETLGINVVDDSIS
jgi:Zn-dependent peptidase ImmA (M78 family)